MLWLHGISWDTPMRDVGWVWLSLGVAVLFLLVQCVRIWRM